jgi:hypothetical protein
VTSARSCPSKRPWANKVLSRFRDSCRRSCDGISLRSRSRSVFPNLAPKLSSLTDQSFLVRTSSCEYGSLSLRPGDVGGPHLQRVLAMRSASVEISRQFLMIGYESSPLADPAPPRIQACRRYPLSLICLAMLRTDIILTMYCYPRLSYLYIIIIALYVSACVVT